MTPGTGAGMVPGVVVFSVMIHGRGGNNVARGLVRAIGNGSRTAPESGYATAWTEENYQDAVMVSTPRGPYPQPSTEFDGYPLTIHHGNGGRKHPDDREHQPRNGRTDTGRNRGEEVDKQAHDTDAKSERTKRRQDRHGMGQSNSGG